MPAPRAPYPPPPASLPRAAPPSCKRTTGGAELRRCLCLSPSPPAGLPSPGAGGPEPAGKAFRKGARPPAQPTSAGCVRAGHPPFPSALSPSPHGVPPPEEGASSPSPQGPCGRGGGSPGRPLSWAAGSSSLSASSTGEGERCARSHAGGGGVPRPLPWEEGRDPQVPWGAWAGFPSQGVCNPPGAAEGLVGRCGVEGSTLCCLAQGDRLVWRALLGRGNSPWGDG